MIYFYTRHFTCKAYYKYIKKGKKQIKTVKSSKPSNYFSDSNLGVLINVCENGLM